MSESLFDKLHRIFLQRKRCEYLHLLIWPPRERTYTARKTTVSSLRLGPFILSEAFLSRCTRSRYRVRQPSRSIRLNFPAWNRKHQEIQLLSEKPLSKKDWLGTSWRRTDSAHFAPTLLHSKSMSTFLMSAQQYLDHSTSRQETSPSPLTSGSTILPRMSCPSNFVAVHPQRWLRITMR